MEVMLGNAEQFETPPEELGPNLSMPTKLLGESGAQPAKLDGVPSGGPPRRYGFAALTRPLETEEGGHGRRGIRTNRNPN